MGSGIRFRSRSRVRGLDLGVSQRRLQRGVQLVVVVTGAVAVAALRAGVVRRLLQPQQHVHLEQRARAGPTSSGLSCSSACPSGCRGAGLHGNVSLAHLDGSSHAARLP
ncbi:hypothetical protein EYF80_035593 [Liparis tanakae]|uniref:Uncharacterized protein n=1 Tax=Liparis tanakae TaxID=230148 RepID=A0A4Z2GLL6_9TELE|nr:hypothetical protein EYF80_035593 [Liparis tanakae]